MGVASDSVHRGAGESIGSFAPRFIMGRLEGFTKDMKICLTPALLPDRKKKTHAYFPALAACCATLEYFVALHRGNLNAAGWPDVAAFAERYMRQPDYDRETIRVLICAFRHAVAHRGIATGVWVDQQPGNQQGRRVVWKITASTKRPACQLTAEAGVLTRDPPWPTPFTHRMLIHLGALWIDIREAARQYATEVASDGPLQGNFDRCMQRLYPTK